MPPSYDFAGLVHEHICLASDEQVQESAKPVVLPATGAAELTQAHPRLHRRAVIFDGTFLGVCTRRSGASTEYWLNLAFVDPKPVRRLNRLWWNLGLGLTLLSGAAFALHFHPAAGMSQGWGQGWAAVLLLGPAAALLSLAVAIHRYFDRLEFLTRHGRVPILRIFRSKSGRSETARFVDLLGIASARALALRAPARSQFLRDELQEHRRLHQQGAFTVKQFEAAKASILRQHR
jgi:hypothetical protein